MSSLIKFVVGSLLALVHMLFRGMVVRDLWYWFVVPLGLPVLSIAHAIGLSGMIFYITFAIREESKDDKTFFQSFITNLIAAFILGLLAWGTGWAVAQFM